MEDIGTLRVRVYTSRAQIPVAGATVAVTGAGEEGKIRLWSVQTTDRNGEVKTISIPTPSPSASTAPGNGAQASTFCDVWAEAPGFAVLLVEGVQIFPGVETLQGMELTPLPEGENSLNQTDVRDIPRQNL